MTKVQAGLRGLWLAFAVVVALVASASAHAGVAANAVGSQLTEANGVATATFKIQVENSDQADITNARVVFAGGIEVAVGDVAAGATVVSAQQKFVFDASTLMPTKHVPVPVTLKYLAGGVETEVSAFIVLDRAE